MSYVRPTWPAQQYRDAGGAEIDDGDRWGRDSPPPEAYSAVSNPQRFAPVVTVARALIDYLARTYDCTVTDTGHLVILEPGAERARLVFAIATGPAQPCVGVQAGRWTQQHFPSCTCDACDEDIDTVAADLERYVFTVVGGGLREAVFGSSLVGELDSTVVGDVHQTRSSWNRPLTRRERRPAAREAVGGPPRWLPWQRRAHQ